MTLSRAWNRTLAAALFVGLALTSPASLATIELRVFNTALSVSRYSTVTGSAVTVSGKNRTLDIVGTPREIKTYLQGPGAQLTINTGVTTADKLYFSFFEKPAARRAGVRTLQAFTADPSEPIQEIAAHFAERALSSDTKVYILRVAEQPLTDKYSSLNISHGSTKASALWTKLAWQRGAGAVLQKARGAKGN
jgi:hypothetical protein